MRVRTALPIRSPSGYAWGVSSRRTAVLLTVVGLAATVLGIVCLLHPVALWPFGAARKSNVPGVYGVGFLVVPIVLIAVALHRSWIDLELDVEARRRRRREGS